jgi:Cu2+-exporting ATPase
MSPADALARPAAPVAADVACTHCGGPVPAGLVRDGAARQFCCAGCDAAFAILHGHGLDGYYELPERREAPVRPSGRSYEEFDHDAFRALYVRTAADGLSSVELYLEGVHCASCVWLVERVPLLLPGVARAELHVRRALARIEWDDAAVPLSAVARTLDGLGYRPHPFRGVRAEAVRRQEDRRMLARIGVAGAIAVNVMLAALALYSGWLGGIEREYERLFRWISLALTAVTLAWPGRVFFTGALAALRARTLHMDVPIALALAAGLARGAVNTVRDAGPIYFDGLATLTFALLAGRYLQQRGQRAAADAAELLHSLAPTQARVVEAGDVVRELPAAALLPGMVLDVRAGDTLPADGVVERGDSTLDRSLLTGESRPARAAAGTRVFAGTVNLGAPLRVRVTRAGESSRLAAILRQVEEGAGRRAPVVLLADRLAGRFVAVVLALAALTLLLWWPTDPGAAMDHAIALLIVTCPCALALATPLAVSVAVGRAARAGILVKGGDVLEQLARPAQLLLDKTGTVTQARTALVRWDGPEWVKPLVLGLEQGSTHPLAEGFRRAWPAVAPLAATGTAHTVGGGIEGIVDGSVVRVGSPRFVRAGVPPGAARDAFGDAARDDALTPVLVAVDCRIVAAAGFGDPLRPDAADAVARLRARGWRVGLLSGDDPAVVAAAGRRLGLPAAACVGGASPEEKLRAVERAARDGRVVMVGDGVNDAAAIAAASVGIGVHGGAESSLATADVYLATPGLDALVRLVDGAGRPMRVIRRNIVFSLAYNVVGAALAMGGWLDPLVAAVLMPASSLTVVLASWRSTTFTAPPPATEAS